MALEIERKFLLKGIPTNLDKFKDSTPVIQTYLSWGPDYEVRITNRGWLTLKKGAGLSREEIPTKVNKEIYDILANLPNNRHVTKTRHYFKLGKYLLEVDEYHNLREPLFTAEIEFPSEEEANAFVPPEWLGEEVTGQTKYRNSNLWSLDAKLSNYSYSERD